MKYIPDGNRIYFTYNHQQLGSCPADEYPECESLLSLMKSNPTAAAEVLDYMNSIGDPVFPVSEDQWLHPETDVSKVDIDELYDAFMQELEYIFRDGGVGEQFGGFDIWLGDEPITGSTNTRYFATMVNAGTSSKRCTNVTQEVLDYTKTAYPALYKELADKDIWIDIWGDGEYSLSYNALKSELYLSDSVKYDLMSAMEELYPGSFWGDVIDFDD